MASFPWKQRGEYVVLQNPTDYATREEYSRRPSSKAAGRRFLVIVLREGDRYGRDDVLTWDSVDPGIEVYDLTWAGKKGFDEKGQFVSRYYAHTIAETRKGVGIDLVGHEPAWKIDGTAWGSAVSLAKSVTAGEAAWRDERRRIDEARFAEQDKQRRKSRNTNGGSRRSTGRCRSARTGRFARC